RSIASEHVAMWTHILHRKTTDRLVSHFDNEFCRQLDEKYYASFTGYKMMANELYVTLVYRPHPSRIGKLFSKASRRSHAEIIADQRKALRRLDELASQVEASMRRYGGDERRGIEVLRTYDKGGALHSQQLEFLNYLLTGEWQPVRVPQAPLNEYLGNAWVFAGTETI
ncbi:type IV secretion protein C, partial [Xanthomonas citri pv. citri]|nr:type IV secretion protein C [Xanthomonas citri pv. citri]